MFSAKQPLWYDEVLGWGLKTVTLALEASILLGYRGYKRISAALMETQFYTWENE